MVALAAFATILNENGAVLLSHRRDLDLWNPPGGGVEDGESPWDAVVRETCEETGLDVRVVRLASVSWKAARGQLLLQFFCEIAGGELRPTEEADQHEYFPAGDLPTNLSAAFRRRFLIWMSDREHVHLLEDSDPSTRELLSGGR